MWILVENLRYYLNSDEIHLAQTGGRTDLPSHLQFPLYLGEPLSKEGATDMVCLVNKSINMLGMLPILSLTFILFACSTILVDQVTY